MPDAPQLIDPFARAITYLRVSVTERLPVILWRGPDGLMKLDREGVAIGPVETRADHGDLPVIAGQGADREVVEALALLALAEPLSARLRGLVRVGERRWTLSLENGIDILLPQDGAAGALARVLAFGSLSAL